MAEVCTWVTSALLPTNEVSYNWKIENFGKWLKVFGNIGIDSPAFKVTSHKNEVHLVKIKLEDETPYSSLKYMNLKEDDVSRSVEEFMLLKVSLQKIVDSGKPPSDDKFPLAGTLDFDLDGKSSSASFGNQDLDKFENSESWTFKNLDSKIVYKSTSSYSSDIHPSGFCIARDSGVTLQLKVRLTTPGYVSNSISLVPNDLTVKETGGTRLMADMKSLLSRADEYADFAIICEGKNFPCHEAILRARSPVLNKMFLQKMKESTTRELIIEDVGEDIIDAFLEYIYSGELTKKVENESELIYIADKYSVPGLLEVCFHRFPEIQEDMVVDILILADRHNLEDFKKVAVQRILADKGKFFSDEDFAKKMKMSPQLLFELVKH